MVRSMDRKKVCQIERVILALVLTVVLIVLCSLFVSGIMDSSSVKASNETDAYKYYTSIQIKQGDSLWSIADAYMGQDYSSVYDYINEVKQINHLGDDSIHAGEYLTIPYYSAQYL